MLANKTKQTLPFKKLCRDKNSGFNCVTSHTNTMEKQFQFARNVCMLNGYLV